MNSDDNQLMPWRIEKRKSQYCVIKTSDRSVAGCHPTRREALKQLAALNIAEKSTEGWEITMKELEELSANP